jgi:hypothetical protein
MAQDRWRVPVDNSILTAVFGDSAPNPCFYTGDLLVSENEHWARETHPGFLGRADSGRPPGDIQPATSILIGDLGPDQPFALDYRDDPPSIAYLIADPRGRWTRVASCVEELLQALGLST